MGEIKWIKITTDIFDDEKILLIETLPDADAIIVIWFKLLCLAGKQNNSGVFVVNDTIPFTDQMLATIFRRKESTVKLALATFEKFGMIKTVDGVITIPNWSKHQSLDKLEKSKKYMVNYMRKYRDKQRLLACKTNSNINSKTNRKTNVSCADKIRLDKNRIEKNKDIKTVPQKIKYAEFVHMTEAEHQKLVDKYGVEATDKMITMLDNYKGSSGHKYVNDYRAILSWVVKEYEKRERQEQKEYKNPLDRPATKEYHELDKYM